MTADRVGLGWRPELAAGILVNLERIDVVEVIADDYVGAGRRALHALRTLARQVPLWLHGVGLGPASAEHVDGHRLDGIARVVGAVEPEGWSEHLAFVRGGGVEIGHLAAPPRNAATVEGAARNLARCRTVVGALPLVENVATLIDPPGSDRDEPRWITDVAAASGAPLLLDLHLMPPVKHPLVRELQHVRLAVGRDRHRRVVEVAGAMRAAQEEGGHGAKLRPASLRRNRLRRERLYLQTRQALMP